jgi:hypothetical protein
MRDERREAKTLREGWTIRVVNLAKDIEEQARDKE